jgi:CelD/BcsL family acetyltransferase involved in cellulose biosynthesis
VSTLLDAPVAPSALVVSEVTSTDALEALQPEWEALWERSPGATPFQHPTWLLAWWRHMGGGELRVLTSHIDGRLAAIWPMFVHTGGGVRQLTPLGNGASDHVDILSEPGAEAAAAPAILEHLAGAEDWNTADFRDLPSGSALLHSVPNGAEVRIEADEPCPALALAESLDRAIPPALVKKVRYYLRRVTREFDISFEVACDERSLDEWFDALVRLHSARRRRQGSGAGVLDDPRPRAFHREAASAFLERGILRLYGLKLDGKPAAAWYGFSAHGRVGYYLGGFDPALERYSPGAVMIGYAMEQAVREGAAEFDFLRGREAYKYAWGARDREKKRLRMTRTARVWP